MKSYEPSAPFIVPAFLLIPTEIRVKGVLKKDFIPEDKPFFCSFKTFGGTETQINGMTVVENTGEVETWYDPKFKAGCNVRIDNVDYEILGTPENINMRNQYTKFKIRALKGGA